MVRQIDRVGRMKSCPLMPGILLFLALGATLAACDDGPGTCKPDCDDVCRVDDGCEGVCECAGGLVCNAGGQCVDPSDCGDTCASLGWLCGDICGEDCGTCGDNEHCDDGQCVCEPMCDGLACGSDGCNGTCECSGGKVCNPDQQCVDPTGCTDTCDSAGWVCGEICGEICGTCRDDESCDAGSCACIPECDGLTCGDDGCGGPCDCASGLVCDARQQCVDPSDCMDTCASAGWQCGEVCGQSCGSCASVEICVAGQCEENANCTDCSLRLFLIESTIENGRLTGVVLGLDYQPGEGEPRPRVADIRIGVSAWSELIEVVEGPALDDAGKDLYIDPITGQPWKRRADGSYQFLAISFANTNTFTAGRMLTMTFSVDRSSPVSFFLFRREEIFAPPEADAAIQASSYERPVVVQVEQS